MNGFPEVKVNGEWLVVVDWGILGQHIVVMRVSTQERFEVTEAEIEETSNYRWLARALSG